LSFCLHDPASSEIYTLSLHDALPIFHRPYKAFGYPVIPFLYILLAATICIILLLYKQEYTWPGLIIVLIGIPVYHFMNKRMQRKDRKSTRLNSSHVKISYAVFCLKKK